MHLLIRSLMRHLYILQSGLRICRVRRDTTTGQRYDSGLHDYYPWVEMTMINAAPTAGNGEYSEPHLRRFLNESSSANPTISASVKSVSMASATASSTSFCDRRTMAQGMLANFTMTAHWHTAMNSVSHRLQAGMSGGPHPPRTRTHTHTRRQR